VDESGLLLGMLRAEIDAVDAGMRRMLALRRRLVGAIQEVKQASAAPLRDLRREAAMQERAAADAQRLGVPVASATALLALVREDALRQQARAEPGPQPLDAALWPGAAQAAAVLRHVPTPLLYTVLEWALVVATRGVLDAPRAAALRGHRFGIEVDDLGLRCEVTPHADGVSVTAWTGTAEVRISGASTDLLALAARETDADTLFFQRRLRLTGDTELGLTLRNLLERLPWTEMPFAVRLMLAHAVRLTRGRGS
jgi:predicted lipid carrier protein YhbT/chorismate mutase